MNTLSEAIEARAMEVGAELLYSKKGDLVGFVPDIKRLDKAKFDVIASTLDVNGVTHWPRIGAQRWVVAYIPCETDFRDEWIKCASGVMDIVNLWAFLTTRRAETRETMDLLLTVRQFAEEE